MGLIAGALRPAIGLWLRSQLDAVETLHIEIAGRDREFLQGHIARAMLQATAITYRGLSLERVELAAAAIELQWQPSVQLRAPVAAALRVSLTRVNLTASLGSPLLQEGIADLLTRAFGTNPLAEGPANWETACFEAGKIILQGKSTRLELGVAALQGRLQLAPVRLQVGERIWETPTATVELGDAMLSHLELDGDRCYLQGNLGIRPAADRCEAAAGQTGLSVDPEGPASR